MVHERSLLVTLIALVDLMPLPAASNRRGRTRVYPERLVGKALVSMLIRRLTTGHLLRTGLDQPTDEMREVRPSD